MTISFTQACDLVGITDRQLEYWTEKNYVWPEAQPPKGSGNGEGYTRLFFNWQILQIWFLAEIEMVSNRFAHWLPVLEQIRENPASKRFVMKSLTTPMVTVVYPPSEIRKIALTPETESHAPKTKPSC